MINNELKQQLLTEFGQFVETLEEGIPNEAENSTDLFTLFEALLALKTEVKQESRQFKAALESFKEVFSALQKNYDNLAQELSQRRQEQQSDFQKQRQSILKPLLLELIEFRDRLDQGWIHAKAHRPTFLQKLFKQGSSFIASILQGQAMLLSRLDQILDRYEVRPLLVANQTFDPFTMRAVAIESNPNLPQGLVIEEIRKGFLWHDDVLRAAEVSVNKQQGEQSSE